MRYHELIYPGHAIRNMFERGIEAAAVRQVAQTGQVIAEYPEDRPYPSRLLLGRVANRSIHVVLAYDAGTRIGCVVTAYEPDPKIWDETFTARRKP